ncbi:DNA-binding protein [Alcaligenaceae bacterium]|nr:DNA-binding protein [Alcaligenaceae bacterium]
MTSDLSADAALLQDIDALRERFTQTQELYREVCALLFFRYGVTPTANRLYQLVRKGSMSAPTEALRKFWEDLRDKSRTRVEHPDLPEHLKNQAGELIATLWTDAQTAAQDSLISFRAESQETVRQAKAIADAAITDRNTQELALQRVNGQLEAVTHQLNMLREDLAAEKQANSSLLVRFQEAKNDTVVVLSQLEAARREFTAELDKLRATSQLAEERSRSTEKRMLVEVDRERTALSKLQKETESLKTTLTDAAFEHKQELNTLQELLGDARQRNGHLEGSLQAATASLDSANREIKHIQDQLNAAVSQVGLYREQAQDVRRQWEARLGRVKKSQVAKTIKTKVIGRRLVKD